ncbi:protein zwilch isoform X1 [Neodiprion virginianus]|uniref:protein zwilch isoform X1 n=1 Tax=Neodiprion virginianus TaxID=2961670 RepID=UPI001EE697D9|nr:protein zwilch isoform X1 [Neodiprion virginianus]
MASVRGVRGVILPDETIIVSETAKFSYDNLLDLLSLKSKKMLFLHRELISNRVSTTLFKLTPSKTFQERRSDPDGSELSDLDVTGSPLEYELGYPKLDETVYDCKNWRKEAEFHSPLSRLEASAALNYCSEYTSDDDWKLPVLAICDGKDADKTVLLGSYYEDGWFTTTQVQILDDQKLISIEKLPAALLKEYIDTFSVQKHKVCIATKSTYELCGKRPGITDVSDLPPGGFNGNLSIEVNWNTLSFYAPVMDSTTTLVMEMTPYWDGSRLKNLWKELKVLDQYLSMLEQSRNNEKLPKLASLNSAISEENREKLNKLINGENERNESCEDNTNENDGHVSDDVKLEKIVAVIKFRENMDFADLLWEFLTGCHDYAQVAGCLLTLLQEVQSGYARPQAISTNSAKINKIISNVIFQKEAMPIISENLLLELLIDAGLRKLCKDYTYILSCADLIDLCDIRATLCDPQEGTFDIEDYRNKLTSLVEIHLCLEFTLFAQNYLNCSTVNLKHILRPAFREHTCKNSTLKSSTILNQKSIQSLKVVIPTIVVEDIIQGSPSSWSLTLSSTSSTAKVTTTSLLTCTPIIPPNIYCFDSSNKRDVYHFLKLYSSSSKIA